MRRLLLCTLALLPLLTAGCTGEGVRDPRLDGAQGIRVTPGGEEGGLVIGLDPVAQTQAFHACASACRDLTLPNGTLVAETALLSLANVSLRAAGPDGDSAVLFYDGGREGGRFLRWTDLVSKFQMNADLQVVGNVTATGHVGTTMPLRFPDGTLVTVSTAALEGIEVAVFARGHAELINGTATIPLPSAFTALAFGDGVTAQVTLRTPGPALFVSEATTESLVVQATDGHPTGVRFDWFVQAPRKGAEGFEV